MKLTMKIQKMNLKCSYLWYFIDCASDKNTFSRWGLTEIHSQGGVGPQHPRHFSCKQWPRSLVLSRVRINCQRRAKSRAQTYLREANAHPSRSTIKVKEHEQFPWLNKRHANVQSDSVRCRLWNVGNVINVHQAFRGTPSSVVVFL